MELVVVTGELNKASDVRLSNEVGYFCFVANLKRFIFSHSTGELSIYRVSSIGLGGEVQGAWEHVASHAGFVDFRGIEFSALASR